MTCQRKKEKGKNGTYTQKKCAYLISFLLIVLPRVQEQKTAEMLQVRILTAGTLSCKSGSNKESVTPLCAL